MTHAQWIQNLRGVFSGIVSALEKDPESVSAMRAGELALILENRGVGFIRRVAAGTDAIAEALAIEASDFLRQNEPPDDATSG